MKEKINQNTKSLDTKSSDTLSSKIVMGIMMSMGFLVIFFLLFMALKIIVSMFWVQILAFVYICSTTTFFMSFFV